MQDLAMGGSATRGSSVRDSTTHAPRLNTAPLWKSAQRPCWDEAGAYHGVDPWLLYAIAYVESNYNPLARGVNKNGSVDLGLMQINDSWLPELHRWGVPDSALFNACASTYIGAWVMAGNFRHYGYSWKAIAAYNVGDVDRADRARVGLAYARRVYAAYAALIRGEVPRF